MRLQMTMNCRSKYGAHRVIEDGIKFASMKEAKRYAQLKMMQNAGLIQDLRLQVPFVLIQKQPGVKRCIKYIADFTYIENGEPIVEDVKGFRTDVYKLKKALMADKYGIVIRET